MSFNLNQIESQKGKIAMEKFPEILMESTLILVVFYLGYILLLSRETSFRQNRFFL